jgi:hypothetical protein
MNDKNQSTASRQRDAVTKVHDVAEQARSATSERVDLVRDQADSAKAKAAERVRKLGNAVRKIGEHMRIEEQLYIAEQANGASQRLESVAAYIDEAELGTLVRDAERIARANPTWVLGGTFLLGLIAGRVLKAPNPSRVAPERALPEPTTTDDGPRNGGSARRAQTRRIGAGRSVNEAEAQR